MDSVFEAEQFVSRPRVEVFEFFSNPRNLETITPPWLGFRLCHQTTPRIERGTELTYRLRVHGFPISWRSRITDWQPGTQFVDVQLKGPYAKWHHTHRFTDRDGGTLIHDRVIYRVPLGRLGRIVAGRFVAADVRKIFAFRRQRIEELFAPVQGFRVASDVSASQPEE